MDVDEKDALHSVQFAARIAEQILKQADDGTKLLSITRNYPSGLKAISYGFHVGLGLIIAVCFTVAVGNLLLAGFRAIGFFA